MKKILSCALLSVFMLGLLVSPGFSQDAKKILEKLIEANGGRKLLESIKDSTASATIDLPEMGMSGTGTMYTKEPNKMRLDLELMGMIITQAFDGEIAWGINPQTGIAEELPEDLAAVSRDSSYGYSAFLHPEKYGITHNYKGKETH